VINEIVQFALLGLGVGALYAFGSQGLIVVYRGSGIINFSLGATAIAGVFLQWELQYEYGHPFLVATFFGILLSGLKSFATKSGSLPNKSASETLDGEPEIILALPPNKSPTLWKKEPAAPRPSCNKESTLLLNAD
jgi:hypothetical protein